MRPESRVSRPSLMADSGLHRHPIVFHLSPPTVDTHKTGYPLTALGRLMHMRSPATFHSDPFPALYALSLPSGETCYVLYRCAVRTNESDHLLDSRMQGRNARVWIMASSICAARVL